MTVVSDTKTCECKCADKTGQGCGCGAADCRCGPDCAVSKCCMRSKEATVSSDATPTKCTFLASHPNWQKCPFMRSMFDGSKTTQESHEQCDTASCVHVPETKAAVCHKTSATHTVTMGMDADAAADWSEEMAL